MLPCTFINLGILLLLGTLCLYKQSISRGSHSLCRMASVSSLLEHLWDKITLAMYIFLGNPWIRLNIDLLHFRTLLRVLINSSTALFWYHRMIWLQCGSGDWAQRWAPHQRDLPASQGFQSLTISCSHSDQISNTWMLVWTSITDKSKQLYT